VPGVGRFGDEADLATRAAMLEEGLTIVRAMWSGQALRHAGDHYDVDLPVGTPDPHRIPVWMASSARTPPVLRRAVACDGIFPIADHTLVPDEVAAVVVALHRTGLDPGAPYDVAVAGNASPAWERPNPDGVDLAGIGQAGATWWMESLIHVDPLEQSLAVVDAGPP
jgi:alkanesulfonate monooxygenase SsuD/methylene tetrahydromethanopterin reductase-like flavin-dependent oxidoreductase (luciferase family)